MKKSFLITILAFSTLLLLVNLYGLTQTLRPPEFKTQELRFGQNDISLTLPQYKEQVQKRDNESQKEYAKRLAEVIAQGTAHIHWEQYEPEKFNQIVPVWENWILYLMGHFSGIPEFERYHFVTPTKSMERGIGVCGEVSMLMEQLLEAQGIPADIVSFKGHVIVSARPEGEELLLDPDFGVALPVRLTELSSNISKVNQIYLNAGYTQQDADFFENSYSGSYSVWDGAHHFIQKKYYFEHVSYVLKWVLPLLGILIAFSWIRRLERA